VTRSAWWKTAAAVIGAGLLAAACGSGGGLYGGGGSSGGATSAATSPAAPSPTSTLCADAAALRASVRTLTDVNVGPGAGDEIKSDLADVKEKLAAFTAQAHGRWQAQASDLKAALAKLQTAASDLASNPSASTVSGAVTALRGVSASAGSLLTAVGTQCPSASASPST
jgi:hypothetical protein